MVPKLVAEDIPLLQSLLSDVFPGVRYVGAEMKALKAEIKKVCTEMNLVYGEGEEQGSAWVEKVTEGVYVVKYFNYGNYRWHTKSGKIWLSDCLTSIIIHKCMFMSNQCLALDKIALQLTVMNHTWEHINGILFIVVVVVLDPSAVSDLPDSSRPDDGWTQWQWQVLSLAYTAESLGKFGGCRGCGTCC